jgi:hypothetical protein
MKSKMSEQTSFVWCNPLALGIGCLVMSTSIICHIYWAQTGRIVHSHQEQSWCALLVSIVLFIMWFSTTFYGFYLMAEFGTVGFFMDLTYIAFINAVITWQCGRAISAVYTIRAWKNANRNLVVTDDRQKSA